MARVLIVYGTTEGHTRRVARFLYTALREANHRVWIADATEMFGVMAPGEYDAVFVCASVHDGEHQRSVEFFVRDGLEALQNTKSALLSVSLNAAVGDEPHRAEAQGYVDRLVAKTGWQPDAVLLVGGALRFGKYDFFRRQVLSLLLSKTVGRVVGEGDHDFTDYQEVRRFGLELLGRSGRIPAAG